MENTNEIKNKAVKPLGIHKGVPSEEAFGTTGSLAKESKKCCGLDTDGDGNCPVHTAPGVLRNGGFK